MSEAAGDGFVKYLIETENMAAIPPVFCELDGKWYWLDELWDMAHGPYETPEEATDAWMATTL